MRPLSNGDEIIRRKLQFQFAIRAGSILSGALRRCATGWALTEVAGTQAQTCSGPAQEPSANSFHLARCRPE
jgi:hypothetical protein